MKHFYAPVVVALAILAAAPLTRVLVDTLRREFSTGYVPLLSAVVGVALLVLFLGALHRIRSRRLQRWSLIGVGLALFALGILAGDRGTVAQAAVERLHYVLYGLLALLFYRAFQRTGHGASSPCLALLALAVTGTLDEGFQWLLENRTGELFDVAVNVYAGLAGVLVAAGLDPIEPGQLRGSRVRRRGAVLAALAVGSVATFVDCVHIGYRVELGAEVFYSNFSERGLLRLNQRRTEELAREPGGSPKPTTRLGRAFLLTDLFQTEALWHRNERDQARHSGQFAVAASESRILDQYYWAFGLTAEQFQATLSPEELRLLLAQPLPDSYVSRARGRLLWTQTRRSAIWIPASAVLILALLIGFAPAPKGLKRPPHGL